MHLLWISLAGALGTLSRHLLKQVISSGAGTTFPYGTLVINVVGSFCIGLVFAVGAWRNLLSPQTMVVLMTGFLGGFTTFSAFSLETVELLREGHVGMALGYASSSVVLSVAATALAMQLVKTG